MRFIMERQSFWNKLQVYTFSSTYGGKKKANRFFFFFFFPIENPNSQVFTNSSFQKKLWSPRSFFWFFFFKEFALVPRVGFLSCSSKMRRQNAFHWCSTCPHIFFFFLLPLLCIVTSIYNSLHLARLQMSFFFLSLDFCSSNICLLSVANGEQILLFCSVTKAFDILTSLLFDTVRIWEYNSVTDVCNFTTNFLFFVFFQTHRDLSTIQR